MTDVEQLARTEAFAQQCKRDCDETYLLYADRSGRSAVAQSIRDANLTEAQRMKVLEALGFALTDAYYGILMALDGASTLGGRQQAYTLLDESGQVVFSGTGELEGYAYEAFHGTS